MKRYTLAAAILIAIPIGWWMLDRPTAPTTSVAPEVFTNTVTNESATSPQVIISGLTVPWDVAFLPDNRLLVTERSGRLLLISNDGELQELALPETSPYARGEGGLLGIAVHPDFADDGWIYLYMTERQNGRVTNRVVRYWLQGGTLSMPATIISDIPGAANHDGGRIEFGPDGHLYITTGDAGNEPWAQDRDSLSGKILRVTDRGEIPNNNPFGTAVYTFGHRNPQGLAWDDTGRLWSTEHGRSGIRSGYDEINLITAGANYGWPASEGDTVAAGTVGPAWHSGANDTWAPASLVFWEGSLFFGGLRGQALYEAVLDGERVVEVRQQFKGEYGRIRTVRLGPDGMFYLTTSNRDGRGRADTDDDKIIRLDPRMFRQPGI